MTQYLALNKDELTSWVGFGVAGNFAGHLEQAGEAVDFLNVAAEEGAPKGIFPFYVPGSDSFLGIYPLSSKSIARPVAGGDLQIEPEVSLACEIEYDDDGLVTHIRPFAFGAHNDCSIRREGANKISEKKNWGQDSKGCADRFIRLDSLDVQGITGSFRLACYLKRGDEVHAYGQDSPLIGYSYYGQRLIDWIVDRLREQTGSPDTPLENVGQYLRDAGRPTNALVSIGATRYTEYGESTYLEPGDVSAIVVYDSESYKPDEIVDFVQSGTYPDSGMSVLEQTVM